MLVFPLAYMHCAAEFLGNRTLDLHQDVTHVSHQGPYGDPWTPQYFGSTLGLKTLRSCRCITTAYFRSLFESSTSPLLRAI